VGNTNILRLQAEANRLRALIEETQKRLSDIETLIGLLGTYDQLLEASARPASELVTKLHESLKRRSNTLKERILDASEEILADGARRLSRDLLPELAKRGVRVGGKDPAANLASYLSREKERFVSDQRAGGWTLRQRMDSKAVVTTSTDLSETRPRRKG
jgi:hypothetical protein